MACFADKRKWNSKLAVSGEKYRWEKSIGKTVRQLCRFSRNSGFLELHNGYGWKTLRLSSKFRNIIVVIYLLAFALYFFCHISDFAALSRLWHNGWRLSRSFLSANSKVVPAPVIVVSIICIFCAKFTSFHLFKCNASSKSSTESSCKENISKQLGATSIDYEIPCIQFMKYANWKADKYYYYRLASFYCDLI